MARTGYHPQHGGPSCPRPTRRRAVAKPATCKYDTWGWFLVALGVLQFFAAFAIWRGASWGRWFGVACASANAILQMLWIPGYPLLALTILPLDIITIYGLLAYGGRRRSAREVRARAQGRVAS
jgi:hypothetical protein